MNLGVFSNHPVIINNDQYSLKKEYLSIHSIDRNTDKWSSPAEFEINLKNVQEMKEAKIDKDLFDKLQMEIKDKSEFKNEITSRMKNEVATQEKELTKESMYETLLKTNNFFIKYNDVNCKTNCVFQI